MSEEEPTDEDDENSVDCKAKFNDIKPAIKKTNKIEIQENELNKSKEKAALSKLKINGIGHDDQFDSEKEDSVNYDSNNSEERTGDRCSTKTNDIDRSNDADQDAKRDAKCSTKSNIKRQFGKNKTRRVSFDPLALFLDAALEGELELVRKTATQVGGYRPERDFNEPKLTLSLSTLICRYPIQVHRRKASPLYTMRSVQVTSRSSSFWWRSALT